MDGQTDRRTDGQTYIIDFNPQVMRCSSGVTSHSPLRRVRGLKTYAYILFQKNDSVEIANDSVEIANDSVEEDPE